MSGIKKSRRVIVVLVFLIITGVVFGVNVHEGLVLANEEQQKLKEVNEQIEEYEREIGRLSEESNTLNNQISQYDAQINLTTLKISQTEEKIRLLGGRIELLEGSLESLSKAFTSRANETYKLSRMNNEPFLLLIKADQLSDAVSSFHYLEKIQEADRDLLVRLEKAQTTYEQEKVGQEVLQNELEEQKKDLDSKKVAKAKLLQITQNDEKKFQNMLSQALALRDAIQAIIAGKGEEIEVGEVKVGDRVADIIPGPSVCSSGGHLHFEVVTNGVNVNPANYLSSKEIIWDNSPDNPFSLSGSWQWPISDPVKITQGYGMTYYADQLRYYGGAPHTGIDMVSSSGYTTVKAVQPGTLFQGSIKCGGGTLRYVRVSQNEGINTYYLHINY